MTFTILASASAPHQLRHQEAMAAGFKKLGISTVLGQGNRANTKFVACWGWRLGKQLRDRGHDVLVMERGYIGDRFQWTSLAFNGLNGYGDFGVQPQDPTRFNKHFKLQPWRETPGEYILIMGQVPGDASLQGRNMMPWYESVAVLAKDAYQLPVRFRPHPLAAKKGYKQDPRHCGKSFGDLREAMEKAHVVVAFNSNSTVDAVIAGVPTIAMDQGSMAWDVSGHKVGDYLRPDREKWASDLAWKQWQLSEISDGSALRTVLGDKCQTLLSLAS